MLKPIKWLILSCSIFVAATVQAQSSEKATNQLRVAAIKAMLFYETNGNFSQDVFNGSVNLWNTVIEGASREGASSSMLVVVEVQASGAGVTPTGRSVELTARYRIADVSGRGKPASFRKTMKINVGSENKFFAGFWLYDTGCHPVELTARIVGQRGTVRKTINLRCGE